jgi:C_GCAxxG_C_C family probable redox protein
MVRAVTGFHGSGGAHRKEPNLNLNAALEEIASGRDRRPLEELPMAVTGHLCGALASGTVCNGLLFGRREARDDLTSVDELSYGLHRRFEAKFGCKTCGELRERYVPLSDNNTCEYITRRVLGWRWSSSQRHPNL